MPQINRLHRQIINTTVARGISTGLNFLVALLIARHAGPAVKGEVTLLVTTMFFFVFFSNILGGQALVYLIPRNKTELLVVPAYLWCCIISVTGFFLLKVTLIAQVLHIPSIVVLGFLSSLIGIHQTILYARQKFGTANLLQIVPLALQVAGILLCYYFLHISNIYAFIYSSLAAYLVTAVLSFITILPHVRFVRFTEHFSWKDLQTSFKYGLLYQLVEILQLLNLRYYFFQLGLQQGSQYLGIYSIGISVLEAVWIIPRSIATVHYVSTSNSKAVNKEVDRTIRLTQTSFILCAAALLVIYCIPAQAYTLIFGQGFKEVKHSMRFLFPGVLIYSIWTVISSFYLGTGRYKELVISTLAGVTVLVVCSRLLIPKYVMSGAGLAASVSFTVSSALLLAMFIAGNKIAPSKFFQKPVLRLKG